MIQLQQVVKGYGGRTLFRDTTLQFPDRGILVLVGANGAGKSTLMRILCGQESFDEGQLLMPKGFTTGYLGQEVEAEDAGTVLETALVGYRDVLNLEIRLTELAEQIRGKGDDRRLMEEMAFAQSEFERVDGYTLVERARALLHGLGFEDGLIDSPFAQLSGGWRMRVVLGRLLLEKPDLLLLDEPTNHLDIDSILWLEEYLRSYDGVVLLTSHDRFFIDRVADKIIALEGERIRMYPGHYGDYLRLREAEIERIRAEIKQRELERADTERFIERFRAKASKAKQVQSRVKQLEREDPMPEVPGEAHKMNMRIPSPPRSPRVISELRSLHFSYGEHRIFAGVDWRLERGQKVALVGPNGAGKSTLLKLLAKELKAEQGEIYLADAAVAGYFAQHQLDVLKVGRTVLETLQDAYPQMDQRPLRGMLGALLFSGDDVNKKVAVLSGGEKARLSLARMLLQSSNLLLLDEPTNHLDMASREIMSRALKEWPGTMVVVSHDRAFLNGFVDHVVTLAPGWFDAYPGTMDEYAWHLEQRRSGLHPPAAVENAAPVASATDSGTGSSEEGGGATWKERKKIRSQFQKETRQLGEAEKEVARLLAMLQNPENAADHQLLLRCQKELTVVRRQVEQYSCSWEATLAKGEELGLELLDAAGL